MASRRWVLAIALASVACGGDEEGTAGASGGGGTAGMAGAAGVSGTSGATSGGSGGVGAGGEAGAGTAGSAGATGGAAGSSGGSAGSSAGAGGAGPAVFYAGVNLAGAEFGESNLPGQFGADYTYPSEAEVDYFLSKGMNVLRIPFRWERVQPTKASALDATELGRLDAVVSFTTAKGGYALLDPHNYARYYGDVVGGGSLTNADFADFWSRLAGHFRDEPRVLFGLMNEPHDMPTEQWLGAANAAISAIRATGASQLVLVPGNAWTGAHSWEQSYYGTANAQVMTGVNDPGNNFAFELHQYLDADFSGTTATCQSTSIGSEKLAGVTNWLRSNGYRGFLAELAGGDNATCQAAVTDMLSYIDANPDVWIGWTWWAAGPWWGSYMFSLEPTDLGGTPVDRPQLAWLQPFL